MSETQSFEAGLAALEERGRQLESGDLPLDDALRLFEEGVELARGCHDQLEAAEQRVAALTRGPDGPTEQPLPDLD